MGTQNMRKGISPLISIVLAIGVTIAITTLVLSWGMPMLNQLQKAGTYDQLRGTFSTSSQIVQSVASEGTGSQRIVPFNIPHGQFRIEDGKARWSMKMNSKLIEPRTRKKRGNVVIFSNVNVSVSKNSSYYVLENGILEVWIKNVGSSSNKQFINASNLVYKIKNKRENIEKIKPFRIMPDNSSNHEIGTGYTRAVETGTHLGGGAIKANIISEGGLKYQLNFILETGADFLIIKPR